MASIKLRGTPATWITTGLFFIGFILTYNIWIYGVLRWERATTKAYLNAVEAQDAKQLDALFWPRHFAPGTSRVINSWRTDLGDFPGQAACDSSRPVKMPDADRRLDFRLWLLSPVIPIIRHRLEVQIGEDGKVTYARYDSHQCQFTPTGATFGSFTNQGLRFGFYIPIPILVCMAIVSWLLAVACRAFGKRIRNRQSKESVEFKS